jgi:pyridoxal 5'-phosphate synthase pdxS subunit
MIRTKGEAGTGDVVEAVRHMRTIMREIREVENAREDELFVLAKRHQASIDLIREVKQLGKLPVPNFSAGGIATPADAAMMMKLGAETVFVGSGIFKSGDPQRRAKAIVESVLFYKDAKKLAEISAGLGEAMVGINVGSLSEKELMAGRGW